MIARSQKINVPFTDDKLTILEQQVGTLFRQAAQLNAIRYQGTGTTNVIRVNLAPTVVFICKFADAASTFPVASDMVVAFSEMQGVAINVSSGSMVSDAVTSIGAAGVTLGTSASVNSDGVEYFAFLIY